MSETGSKPTRKSRAPIFLVVVVGIVIVVAAILVNISNRGNVPADMPSAIPADSAMPALGTPPARTDTVSIAVQSAEMTASRRARRETRRQQLQDARQAMASRFEQESVDPAWSAGKETSLQAVAESQTFKQAGIVPESLLIDCRSTVCKVNATHASYGASADWAMIYMTSSAGEVTHTFTKTTNNPDGTTSVEIYAQAR